MTPASGSLSGSRSFFFGTLISMAMESLERGKSTIYYRVLSALDQEGCPICRVVIDASKKLLDSLFYELVNDGPTRQWLEASNGFCNWHVWQAARMTGAQSGLALIYQSVLENILMRFSRLVDDAARHPLRGSGRTLRKIRSSRSLLEQNGPCQICHHAIEMGDMCLSELVRWLEDEAVRTAFQTSFGLCLPHMDRAVRSLSNERNLVALLRVQHEKCEKLNSELKEMIRKLSYQYSKELPGQELGSWKRAVEMVAGKSGVFYR